jgi:hypothetical protein
MFNAHAPYRFMQRYWKLQMEMFDRQSPELREIYRERAAVFSLQKRQLDGWPSEEL